MVNIQVTDQVAHAIIRALEDAGCVGYANMVRDAAQCASEQCIMPHNGEG